LWGRGFFPQSQEYLAASILLSQPPLFDAIAQREYAQSVYAAGLLVFAIATWSCDESLSKWPPELVSTDVRRVQANIFELTDAVERKLVVSPAHPWPNAAPGAELEHG